VWKCEFPKLNGWIRGRWIWDEFSSHVFKPFKVWNSCVLFYKISICQWDEIQGMILNQDEGMDFQPSNLWIFIKFFNNLWDNISCLKGVDNRVCFSAWDTVEISYHYLCVVIIYLHISHFSPPSTHRMMNAKHQDHATSHHINVQHHPVAVTTTFNDAASLSFSPHYHHYLLRSINHHHCHSHAHSHLGQHCK